MVWSLMMRTAENEGDLTLAAEFVTPEAINFMAKFGRGLICLTLTGRACGLSAAGTDDTGILRGLARRLRRRLKLVRV